jgi:hypothetical protein
MINHEELRTIVEELIAIFQEQVKQVEKLALTVERATGVKPDAQLSVVASE